jgi:hypothetical protein
MMNGRADLSAVVPARGRASIPAAAAHGVPDLANSPKLGEAQATVAGTPSASKSSHPDRSEPDSRAVLSQVTAACPVFP